MLCDDTLIQKLRFTDLKFLRNNNIYDESKKFKCNLRLAVTNDKQKHNNNNYNKNEM